MENMAYQEVTLEHKIKAQFGVSATIQQTIVHQVLASPVASATLFLTNKKQLFLYITARSKLTLADVKKAVSRMGLKADTYLPPKGRPDYFKEIGTMKFNEVFPGRKKVSDSDIMFYKTLAPYNPALVLISEIKDGHVYQYDSDSHNGWRVAAKFTYRRIKTS